MALIPCPECSRQISDKAAFCPQCGYPMNPAPRANVPRPVPGARPASPAPEPAPRPVYQQPQTYTEAPPRVVHQLTDDEMAELCPGMVSTSAKKVKKEEVSLQTLVVLAACGGNCSRHCSQQWEYSSAL